MGMSGNPVGAMMAQRLIQSMAQAGGGQGGPGGPMPPTGAPAGAPSGPGGDGGPSGPDSSGIALASQFAELNGADPDMMVKTLMQMKSMLVSLFNKSAFQVPGVARHVSQSMKHIDGAIKEAQQASATVNAVKNTIGNNAAISMPGGMTSAGGDASTPGGF